MDQSNIKRSRDNDEKIKDDTKKQKQEIKDKNKILEEINKLLNEINENLENKYVCDDLSEKIPYVTYKVGEKPCALLRLNNITKLENELTNSLDKKIWKVRSGSSNDIIINYVEDIESNYNNPPYMFGITFPDDKTNFRIHITLHANPAKGASDFSFHLTFSELPLPKYLKYVNLLQTSSKNFTDSIYEFDTIKLQNFLNYVKNYTKITYKDNRRKKGYDALTSNELDKRVENVIGHLSSAIHDFEKTLTSIVNKEKLTKSASCIIGEDSENLPNMYEKANEYKKLYLDNCKNLDDLYKKLEDFKNKYLTFNNENFENHKILEYNNDINECISNITQIGYIKEKLDKYYILINKHFENMNLVIDKAIAIAKDTTKEKKFDYKQKYLKYKAKYLALKNK
jgi:hypothetical protein